MEKQQKKTIVVSRTPYRINLAGATDLIPYVKKFGGTAFSGAIDKYVTIIAQRRHDKKIIFHNALETEEASDAKHLKNHHVRAVLQHVGVRTGLDLISFTDTPLASGLGSSGAFVVGLLHTLWTLEGRKKSPRELAEEAAHVEIHTLKAPIGKHDQYLAAYGGICALTFLRNGEVRVKRVALGQKEKQLEKSLLLAYSGMPGPTAVTLSPVSQKLQRMEPAIVASMHDFGNISRTVTVHFMQKDFISFGTALNDLWELEKKTFCNSNERLDALISAGKKQGAISALVVGAGGGGFLYFVCPNAQTRTRVRRVIDKMGATEYPFSFTEKGSTIIFSA